MQTLNQFFGRHHDFFDPYNATVFKHIPNLMAAGNTRFSVAGSIFHQVVHQAMHTITCPRGYKTFFTINSTEHDIFPAHKC